MISLIDSFVCIFVILRNKLLTIVLINEIVSDRLKMDDRSHNINQTSSNGLCQNQPCNCKRCKRNQQYLELLNRLTEASKATDYEDRISSTVAAICAVRI